MLQSKRPSSMLNRTHRTSSEATRMSYFASWPGREILRLLMDDVLERRNVRRYILSFVVVVRRSLIMCC